LFLLSGLRGTQIHSAGRIQGTEPCVLFAASFLRGPTVFNLRGLRAELEFTLRPTVNWLVCPCIGCPPAVHDHILITFEHLLFSSCRAPFLTRGRECNLLVKLLLGLPSAFPSGSKSRRIRHHVLQPHLKVGFLSFALYAWQGSCGGIPSRHYKTL
jgi:hypothetical protein